MHTAQHPKERRDEAKRNVAQSPRRCIINCEPNAVQAKQNSKKGQQCQLCIWAHPPQRDSTQEDDEPEAKRDQPINKIAPTEPSKKGNVTMLINN
jgi:hypothetical protein